MEEEINEIKDLFKHHAIENAEYNEAIDHIVFNRDDTLIDIYATITYSSYYSAQKEKQRRLLELFKIIDDETLEQWQEEIYREYEEKIKQCEIQNKYLECDDLFCEFLHCCKLQFR